MKVNGAITALVLSALSLTCDAGELVLHTFSVHSKYNSDVTTVGREWDGYRWVDRTTTIKAYNNRNFGLSWRQDGLIFGAYHNSYYRTTVYLGREFMLNRYVGGFLGLGTGYRHDISPLGGILLKAPIGDRVQLELIGTPKIGEVDGVLHLATSYRF